jgi:hypothetical protein
MKQLSAKEKGPPVLGGPRDSSSIKIRQQAA